MVVHSFIRRPAFIFTVGLILLGCAALVSATKNGFNFSDKAFYLDDKEANFVRPGLVVKILSVEIATDGTAKARVSFADPRGVPLDRLGIYTPGTISASFILATIPKDETTFKSYTTRVQTSPITRVSATQAGADTGGSWSQVAEGEYLYTFGTKAPSGYDRTATHAISVYANRNLTEFDLGVNTTDATLTFVPDGSKVTVVRDIVKTATCNKCHDKLSAHGTTGRSTVENCVTCHQPQTTDPDTGNTVDMTVMIHKIHYGAGLPSVKAGKPYQIIGNAQSMHDFSDVVFPADARNCESCHDQSTTAAQKDQWLKPNRRACGSCHDNVNFATGENHANLVQTSDAQCSTCHAAGTDTEYDLTIRGAHTIPTRSKELPGTTFELLSVDDGAPGKKPVVSFSLKDKEGKPILPSEMARLALVLSGPTTDYGGDVTEDVRATATGSNGTYTYTFNAAVPAAAKGSFAIGIEGYRNITIQKGKKREQVVRDAGVNKVMTFAVTDPKPVPRRTVVTLEKCNACHSSLSLHGNNRNTIEQCVLCHNPTGTDVARRPAAQGPPESVDFRSMIHKIHTGKELSAPYSIFGFGGTAIGFNEVGFPGKRNNCSMCHVNNSEQLPLPATHAKVVSPRGPVTTMGPETAACTSCHTSLAAASHALANTTAVGESCSACHGPSSEFAVSKVHAQ